MRYKLGIFLMCVVILLGTAGCSDRTTETKSITIDQQAIELAKGEDKLIVITSIFPLYDFSSRIGGDQVAVFNMLPPGADAHDYEPTAKQTMAIADADIFAYNGAGFELWIDKILGALDGDHQLHILNATEGLPLLEANEEEHDHEHSAIAELWYGFIGLFGFEHEHHDHGPNDPHVWLNPQLALQQAEKVLEVLIQVRPEQAEYFTNNFSELRDELILLDQQFEEQLQDMSERTFVVSHSGYAYLAERYQLEQVAIAGIHPGSEPSNKEIRAIIDFLKQSDNRNVFFETTVSNKTAQVIATEANAQTLVLHPLENVTLEDLNNGESYVSIMYRNLENLKTGLTSK